MLLIQNGIIHDGIHREPRRADLLLRDGKIAEISEQISKPADCTVIDAGGLSVYPGFVEAHGHIGLAGYGQGLEGVDYNENNDIVSPQLRGIDSVKPMLPSLRAAAMSGVTSVCVGPGSANVLGGTFTTIKTVGRCVDDMLIRDGVAMKCAFGENPKRSYRTTQDSARMTTAAHLREALLLARDYMERKEAAGDDRLKQPAFNFKCEALIPVLKGEMPLKAHAHEASDIFTAIRIAKEFNLKLTLEHVTEGHLIVEELARINVPLAVGPTLSDASKYELRNRSWLTPGILAKAGCQVSIITDSPVIPQEYLPLCAGMAIKSGMDPFDALRAITIQAARHAGIADRVGSLEVGKDADLSIFEGSPFSLEGVAQYVLINGRIIKAPDREAAC